VPTQLTTQAPDEQSSPEAHWFEHPPQLAGSVLSSVQKAWTPDPHAFGVAAGQPQVPCRHCWPAGHEVPQAPQLLASSVVSAQ
jgi:hypothetical protein